MERREVSERLQDLLAQQRLGELSSGEEAELARALAADPTLAEEAASLDRTIGLLARSVSTAPPAALRRRLIREVGLERSERSARGSARHRAYIGNRPALLAASIAAIAVMSFAYMVVSNGRLERRLELQQSVTAMLSEPNIVLSFTLEGSGSASAATGMALLDLDAKRASFVVQGLPAAPAGKSYALWAILESTSVWCGEFTTDADGRIRTQFPIPVDSYTSPIQKLILSVETAGARSVPRGAIVMQST